VAHSAPQGCSGRSARATEDQVAPDGFAPTATGTGPAGAGVSEVQQLSVPSARASGSSRRTAVSKSLDPHETMDA